MLVNGIRVTEAYRPYARCQVVRLRLWSPSTTRVRSQLFWSYASSTGPVGPTRVVVGFRRGGRDLFCSALCLRVRLTRVVRLCVARVSPGARRPDACRSMVWLRFWSPSTTRVRSQLFVFVEKDTVKRVRSSSSSLYVARVSPGARRPDACRSMGFDRKGGTLLYWREGNGMQRSAVARVDLGVIYLS